MEQLSTSAPHYTTVELPFRSELTIFCMARVADRIYSVIFLIHNVMHYFCIKVGLEEGASIHIPGII